MVLLHVHVMLGALINASMAIVLAMFAAGMKLALWRSGWFFVCLLA
jgi:hypothetical protein